MIHIAVVEDEKSYRDELETYIRKFAADKDLQIHTSFYTDGDEIAEEYPGGFDIILMDIQMQFMDGMTAARRIREVDPQVILMFITNMMQYAIRGYEVDALDYIVKPVSYAAFCQKMERAIERIPEKDDHAIVIATGNGVVRLPMKELFYVESSAHNLLFHTKRGTYQERARMQDLEEELTSFGFFRCNKGILVNLDYVDGVEDGCCLLRGERLPIARARRAEFMTALLEHIH